MPTTPREVLIPSGADELHGDLVVAEPARGLAVFAHGSGSSRKSGRNKMVARMLNEAGFATLLFDLLTPIEEDKDRYTTEFRFDIPLLARRMVEATQWVDTQGELRGLPLGYFGASTGSAAALIAASRLGARISAVVSRGGRPDLASPQVLAAVKAPTLLLVGGEDGPVIGMNEKALRHLACEKEMTIVPHANHLFEQEGTLEQVAQHAARWFDRYLVPVIPDGT